VVDAAACLPAASKPAPPGAGLQVRVPAGPVHGRRRQGASRGPSRGAGGGARRIGRPGAMSPTPAGRRATSAVDQHFLGAGQPLPPGTGPQLPARPSPARRTAIEPPSAACGTRSRISLPTNSKAPRTTLDACWRRSAPSRRSPFGSSWPSWTVRVQSDLGLTGKLTTRSPVICCPEGGRRDGEMA